MQYDTDQQVAEDFFVSVDYQQYLSEGGRPFKKDIFLQSKCFCIAMSDFSECTCPPCTLMRETARGWHQQRAKWHREYDKEGAAPCSCGKCAKGSPYREASGSLGKLREFVHQPCGKQSFPELAIQAGPKKTTSTVEFYRRECCRAPLPPEACPDGQTKDCNACGWKVYTTTPPCTPLPPHSPVLHRHRCLRRRCRRRPRRRAAALAAVSALALAALALAATAALATAALAARTLSPCALLLPTRR